MKIGETAHSLHPIQTIFKVNPIAFFCKRLDILVLNIHEPETTVFTTNNIISTLTTSPRSMLKYIIQTIQRNVHASKILSFDKVNQQ